MEIDLSKRPNIDKPATQDGLEQEKKDPKENKIAGWIFFLIVGMIMVYSASADEMTVAMDDLFQKIIGFAALAFIACLVIRKLTK